MAIKARWLLSGSVAYLCPSDAENKSVLCRTPRDGRAQFVGNLGPPCLFITRARSRKAVSRRRRASAKRDALDTDRAIYSAGEKFKSTGRRGSLRPLSASTALDASLINETLLEQIAQLAAKRLD